MSPRRLFIRHTNRKRDACCATKTAADPWIRFSPNTSISLALCSDSTGATQFLPSLKHRNMRKLSSAVFLLVSLSRASEVSASGDSPPRRHRRPTLTRLTSPRILTTQFHSLRPIHTRTRRQTLTFARPSPYRQMNLPFVLPLDPWHPWL